MLVLSRRPDEKILLPTVPAVLKVISSQNGLVRIGISAPPHVPILREELCRRDGALPAPAGGTDDPSATGVRSAVRNHLHNLVLGLTLLRMHLADRDPTLWRTLEGMEEELQALRDRLGSADRETAEPLLEPERAGRG
jgi:carbon storage regulator CsrA